jgi:biotin carboxyl carrier protein
LPVLIDFVEAFGKYDVTKINANRSGQVIHVIEALKFNTEIEGNALGCS